MIQSTNSKIIEIEKSKMRLEMIDYDDGKYVWWINIYKLVRY